jgi:hypothetical protein
MASACAATLSAFERAIYRIAIDDPCLADEMCGRYLVAHDELCSALERFQAAVRVGRGHDALGPLHAKALKLVPFFTEVNALAQRPEWASKPTGAEVSSK